MGNSESTRDKIAKLSKLAREGIKFREAPVFVFRERLTEKCWRVRVGIFSKSSQKSNVRISKEPASLEKIDVNHGQNWMDAREDLQREIEHLFPLVLQLKKKPNFDENHYSAYENDFQVFRNWCNKWMSKSDTSSTMYSRLGRTDQPLFDLMEKIVEDISKKRLVDSGYPQGTLVAPNELILSRKARVEESEDLFRYEVLIYIEEIIKLSKMFLEVDVVVPWTFDLPDTLMSKLTIGHLVSFYDRNFEFHEGEFRTFWGLDYSMFLVAFITSCLISEDRIGCKVKEENRVSQMNLQLRTLGNPWFIGEWRTLDFKSLSPNVRISLA